MKTVDRVVQGPGGNEGNSHHETLPPPLTSPRVLLVVPWPGRFCRPARREMSADARRAEDEVRAPGEGVARGARPVHEVYFRNTTASCSLFHDHNRGRANTIPPPVGLDSRSDGARAPTSCCGRRNAVARFRSRRWSALSDRHWARARARARARVRAQAQAQALAQARVRARARVRSLIFRRAMLDVSVVMNYQLFMQPDGYGRGPR